VNEQTHAGLKKPSNALTPLAPTTVVEVLPTPTGNLKQRGIDFGNEILEDLFIHGWPNRYGNQAPQFPMAEKMPDPHDFKANNDWVERRSRKFLVRYLDEAIELRDEFAAFHLKDDELNVELDLAKRIRDGQLNTVVLPQSEEQVARKLIEFASRLPASNN
jgi:hypothetical protein